MHKPFLRFFSFCPMTDETRLVEYLLPGQEQDVLESFCPPPFSSLKIQKAITTFLPGCRFHLLYRASRDGWSHSDFHRLCDHQGPTVTVLTSTGDYIFGGYVHRSWKSRNDYVNDPNAFLFSVKRPEGLEPTKLGLKQGRANYAMYDHALCGPTFGDGKDIYVCSGANGSGTGCSSHSHLKGTYELPAGCPITFFTESQDFRLVQMEVYKVTTD